MLHHIIAFSIGIVLDLIIGDPYNLPHPIKAIGKLVGWLDKMLMDSIYNERVGTLETATSKWRKSREYSRGVVTVFIVLAVTVLATDLIMHAAYMIHPIVGVCVEAIFTCYVLAAKSLYTESMKVYKALNEKDIEQSRYAVSMIVGRDTKALDETGIAKAAIETVAENTSDGVIAPLIYTFIGGPILGLAYKAINTMDSMIGYHNDRYEYFGTCAAKLDDIVNFLPARISALSMIAAAYICGLFSKIYDGKSAYRIFKRDRFNHKSPNSAQTESACAGALHIRLAGDASYFGKIVKKPFIGDDDRAIEYKDIKRANILMLVTYGVVVVALILISRLLMFYVGR